MSTALKAFSCTETEATLEEQQRQLEYLFSKNQLIPRLTAEFSNPDCGFIDYLAKHQIPEKFGISLLVQMALHRRATLPTLVGILKHHMNSAQETADMLLKAAQADLVDWSPDLRLFIVKYVVTPEVQAELDRFQFPLPMVVEPKKIKNNTMSGYLLNNTSVILRDNHHNDDVCLDHLNRMNKIKLTINHRVAKAVKNSWRNLDKPKEGESREEYLQRKKAFEKYDTTAKDVMDVISTESGHFYLTHRYDKRGRVYSMGYHVNYQGNPWNKAVIELADKEIIP
jgi:hypothetical protein